MITLPLDTETLPTDRPEIIARIQQKIQEERDAVKAPSTYKDPEKIREYIIGKNVELDDKFDELVHKTGLSGTFGRIFCIGYAFNDEPIKVACEDDREELTLKEFFSALSARLIVQQPLLIVAHNAEFDIRFITQRAIRYGISIPRQWPKLGDIKPIGNKGIYCTMSQWAGFKQYISFDDWCLALGIEGKPKDFDGSKVWEAYKAGEYGKIVNYCRGDVSSLRNGYYKMQAIHNQELPF